MSETLAYPVLGARRTQRESTPTFGGRRVSMKSFLCLMATLAWLPGLAAADPCQTMLTRLAKLQEELEKPDSKPRKVREHRLEANKARQKCLRRGDTSSEAAAQAILRLGSAPAKLKTKSKAFKKALRSSGCFKIPYADLHQKCLGEQKLVNSICKAPATYAGCKAFTQRLNDEDLVTQTYRAASRELNQMRETAQRIVPELSKCAKHRAAVNAIYEKDAVDRVRGEPNLPAELISAMLKHLDDGGNHEQEIKNTNDKREKCKNAIEEIGKKLRTLDAAEREK